MSAGVPGAAQAPHMGIIYHIKALIKRERTTDSRVKLSSAVTGVQYEIFDGSLEDMGSFFEMVMAKPTDTSVTRPLLVISPQTQTFGMLWREYCHKLRVNANEGAASAALWERSTDHLPEPVVPESDALSDAVLSALPSEGKQQSKRKRSAKGAKPQPTLVKPTHLLRVRFVPTRTEERKQQPLYEDLDFDTSAGIHLLCLVMLDKRLSNLERLSELPHLIVRALLSRPKEKRKPKEAYLESVLAERFRDDPLVRYQMVCSYVFEAATNIAAQEQRESDAIEQQKRAKMRMERIASERSGDVLDDSAIPDGNLSKPALDATRFVIAAYLYFRVKLDPLCLPVGKSETAFGLVMYFFEEVILASRDEARQSMFMNMSEALARKSESEIQKEPHVFAEIFEVAVDAIEYIRYKYTHYKTDEEPPRGFKALDAIYESTRALKTSLARITAINDANDEEAAAVRRVFYWQRCQPTCTALVEQELERRMSIAKAQQVRNFRRIHSECCAFVLPPNTNGEELRKSIAHMNSSHPMFYMRNVSFESDGSVTINNSSDLGVKPPPPRWAHSKDARRDARARIASSSVHFPSPIAIDDAIKKAKEIDETDFTTFHDFCIINDGGQSFVIFSSPSAHQHYCNYAVMECLTTPGQVKLMPMFPFLLRQYAGVFGRYAWSPLDVSELCKVSESFADTVRRDVGAENAEVIPSDKERCVDIDKQDNHGALLVFVKTLFYQLCRLCSTSESKRLSDSVHMHLLEVNEANFGTYRWLHEILSFVKERTGEDYPFCVKPRNWTPQQPHQPLSAAAMRRKRAREGVTAGSFGMRERQNALAWLGEIVLCFLCLGAVHTLPGDVLERLYTYLELDETKRKFHKRLWLYLTVLKLSQERAGESAAAQFVEGEDRLVRLLFDSQVAYDLEIHEPTEEDPDRGDTYFTNMVNGGHPYSVRKSAAVVNSLFYGFVTDGEADSDLRWQVITALDCQCQVVTRSYTRMVKKRPDKRGVIREKGVRQAAAESSQCSSASASAASSTLPSPVASRTTTPSRTPRPSRFDPERVRWSGTSSWFQPPPTPKKRSADDSSAASSIATLAVGTPLRHIHRDSLEKEQIANSIRATLRDVRFKEGGLRNSERLEKAIAKNCDVYRGAEKIQSTDIVQSVCKEYANVFCYDEEWDLGRSLIMRTVGISATFGSVDGKLSLKEIPDEEDQYEDGGDEEDEELVSLPDIRAGNRLHDFKPASVTADDPHIKEVYDQLFSRVPLTASEPRNRLPTVSLEGVPRLRQPISYVTGECDSSEEFRERIKQPCGWRYEQAVEIIEWQKSIQPMGDFLREVEWFLYKRSYADTQQRDRCSSTLSESVWILDANRFVRRQLNSQLPVEFTPMPLMNEGRIHAGSSSSIETGMWVPDSGLFSYLDQGLWVLKLGTADADEGAREFKDSTTGETHSAKLNALCRDYCNKVRGVMEIAENLHPGAAELRTTSCVMHMLENIAKGRSDPAYKAQAKPVNELEAGLTGKVLVVEEEEQIEQGVAPDKVAVVSATPPEPTPRSAPTPQFAPASMPPPPPRPVQPKQQQAPAVSVPINRPTAPQPPVERRSMLKPAYDELDELLSGLSRSELSGSMFGFMSSEAKQRTDDGGGGGENGRRNGNSSTSGHSQRYTGPAGYYSGGSSSSSVVATSNEEQVPSV